VFDGSILATAAVSAPAVLPKSVRTVLDGFDDLGEKARELLFETCTSPADVTGVSESL
jgi:hypothetical protein